MKFIALKTKDGELKGDTTFFCRILYYDSLKEAA